MSGGQAVDEILAQAIQAGQEASNRAMKRRVRQRLHKKLGTMLSTEPWLVKGSYDSLPRRTLMLPCTASR